MAINFAKFFRNLFGIHASPKPVPTPVAPPPPPALVSVRIEVFAGDPSKDDKVVGALVDFGQGGVHVGLLTDGAGNGSAQLRPGTYDLAVRASGFDDYSQSTSVDGTTLQVSLKRALPRFPGGGIVVDGKVFKYR